MSESSLAHRARRLLLTVVLIAELVAPVRRARAGEREDAALAATLEAALPPELTAAGLPEALRRARAAVDKCKGCSTSALARAHVAIGTAAARLHLAAEAKRSWTDGLVLDPGVAPPDAAPAAVRQDFAALRKAWLLEAPAPTDSRSAGWVLKDGYAAFKLAAAAAAESRWTVCVGKAEAALTLEENVRARALLARCEEESGALVRAAKDSAKALERARADGDSVMVAAVQERVMNLLPKLGHLKIERPVLQVVNLRVTFDDRPIPEARLEETFTVDPGAHRVHAEGSLHGAVVSTDEQIEVKQGETAVIRLDLKPTALTQGQLECLAAAKTPEEIAACLPRAQKPLIGQASLQMSGYSDSIDVQVLSPSVRGALSSPTGGWNVGASYLVDVVTAASPDVVATASPRFRDVRHAVGVTGGYKPGAFGVQAIANYSQERDYISRSAGATLQLDVRKKSATPFLGYVYTWNTLGRAGTDYEVFSRRFDVHDITTGSTLVFGPRSVVVIGGGLALEDGDQSKPYRFIPLFEPGVSVPIGASVDEVNRARLPVKALEQLPLDRQRFNLMVRSVTRIGGKATLRLEERGYRDTWGITASTTDVRLLLDAGARFRWGPHLRLHVQSGARFYRRIYGGILDADGFASLPQFRTSDRELGPMLGVTGGGTARYALTPPRATVQFALFASGDFLVNRYFNALYLTTRYAGYGTLGVEAEFQ